MGNGNDERLRLVVVGPVPPPHHGVSISTRLVVANRHLRRDGAFRVEHFDTSDHRSIENVGRWDLGNAAMGAGAVLRFARRLRGKKGIVYLPISQGLPGLTRDSLMIRLAARRGWRVAVHLRGSELSDVVDGLAAPIRWWLGKAFAEIDAAAVLGSSVRGALDGVVPADRVAVVPNGTPDPGHRGWPKSPPTVLCMCNFSRRKGVLSSMEAALRVVEAESDVRFVFAGDEPEHDTARQLRAMAARAEDRITVRRPLLGNEKSELLASATALMFTPFEPEGQPRVVLEAMAVGLPVITTDRGTIAETVGDGLGGIVHADPVPDELAASALRLLRDPELHERLSHGGRARYLERFSEDASDAALARWLVEVGTTPHS